MRRPVTPRPKEIVGHIQVATFLKWAWPDGLLWWHTPNGEARDKATAKKLKAMGVRPGVFEFTFIMPNGQAAFLEMKRAGEGLSDEQHEFQRCARLAGCACAVAHSLEEAVPILSHWLGLFGLKLKARPLLPRRAA